MTRLELINFIRENSKEYKNYDFKDYSQDDLYRLYLRIPLPPDKEKERDREFPIIAWWGRIGMKLPPLLKKDASFNFPANILTMIWILLLNPVMMFLLAVIGIMLSAMYFTR